MSLTIGWVGTGVMGRSMCGHLVGAGHRVRVFSRTRSKTDDLVAKGAEWVASPREAAVGADVVFTMVGFPADVRDVYFGDAGVLTGARPGAIVVDMTSTAPSLAVSIDEQARARGIAALDAPVSGGDIGARNAALSIMVGGESAAFDAVRPLFERLGTSIVHQGPAGAGQHAKLCNQIVVAGAIIGVCEALFYGQRAGLNLETMLRSIRGGAAACWTLDHLAPRVLRRDFEPGFFVDHFVKDMGLVLEECRRMGIELPGLRTVHEVYTHVQALGYGRKGTQGLYLAMEKFNEA